MNKRERILAACVAALILAIGGKSLVQDWTALADRVSAIRKELDDAALCTATSDAGYGAR